LRGLPLVAESLVLPNTNIKIYNHLDALALNELIDDSTIVVSRSGYSTIMDLAILQKTAIFVPTPGQTEQEYLAKYLNAKNYCIAVNQHEFLFDNVIAQIKAAKLKSYPSYTENNLDKVLATLL